MTEIDRADAGAAGRRGGGGSPHAYRVRGLSRSGVVLWIGGGDDEPDRVLTSPAPDRRRVPLFVTARQARVYARRQGRRLATSEVGTLELVRVERWLEDPARRHVPPGAVLDAWHFFEDLARGLDAVQELPELPAQGAVHDSAYERLFGNECAAWTPDERRAVLALLRAGVALWNSCPVTLRPRSGGVSM